MNIFAHKTVFLQTDNDIFNDIEHIKSSPVIKLPDDPIALGCASYRLGLKGLGQYHDFDNLAVQSEDREMAQNIRNYYRAKITWQMLKNTNEQRPVSEFRRKLMGIIERTHDITQADIGILYRIPYFYVEDREHDAIFADLPEYSIVQTPAKNLESTMTLTRRVQVLRRTRSVTQYWFSVENTVVPCMATIDNQNVLRHLFDSIVDRGPVRLEAHWYPKTLWGSQGRDRDYYQLAHIRLV
jgi:hypothetical protein